MEKPKPRDSFTNDADEYEHLLDHLCWECAERMSLDLDIPQRRCADTLKRYVLEGRMRVEPPIEEWRSKRRDKVQLVLVDAALTRQ